MLATHSDWQSAALATLYTVPLCSDPDMSQLPVVKQGPTGWPVVTEPGVVVPAVLPVGLTVLEVVVSPVTE